MSTRLPPPGFNFEGSWKVYREPTPGTHPIYECLAPGPTRTHTFVDRLQSCANLQPMGPLGYVFDTQVPNSVPLDRCRVDGYTHFVSSTGCGPWVFEDRLGYAYQ